MQGRIIKQISNDYTVEANENLFLCKCRGVFRKEKIFPLVGDFVLFDPNKRVIEKILPRKNELLRPRIANVDQGIIITSVKDPLFSSNLLDKLLVHISFHGIEPVIVLSKLDLLTAQEKEQLSPIISYYKKYYKVYENTDLEGILKELDGHTSVFTGQSGAGKSTLLNHLNPSLFLETNEISKALGRGKHTTRHVEFLSLENGFVADTPGFSSLDFREMKPIEIRDQFPEFLEALSKCEYQDCMHDKENHCEVKKLVSGGSILPSRYENYLKFIGRKEI